MLLSPRICLVQKLVFQKNQCDLRSQRALGYHIESSHEVISFVHMILNVALVDDSKFVEIKKASYSFISITAMDNLDNRLRYQLVYTFFDYLNEQWLYMKLFLGICYTATSSTIYFGAYSAEREIWDMYSIFFLKHEDQRRILTDYGFKGHPLKKDFPLVGFMELSFSIILKALQYKKVSLVQELRNFTFLNPWATDCFYSKIIALVKFGNNCLITVQTHIGAFLLRLIRRTPRSIQRQLWLLYYIFLSLPPMLFSFLLYLSCIEKILFRVLLPMILILVNSSTEFHLVVLLPVMLFLKLFNSIVRMLPSVLPDLLPPNDNAEEGITSTYQDLDPRYNTPENSTMKQAPNNDLPKNDMPNPKSQNYAEMLKERYGGFINRNIPKVRAVNQFFINQRGYVSAAGICVGIGCGIIALNSNSASETVANLSSEKKALSAEIVKKDELIDQLRTIIHEKEIKEKDETIYKKDEIILQKDLEFKAQADIIKKMQMEKVQWKPDSNLKTEESEVSEEKKLTIKAGEEAFSRLAQGKLNDTPSSSISETTPHDPIQKEEKKETSWFRRFW